MVLIHASGLGALEWAHLGAHLSAHRDVAAIQLVGYPGSSELDDASYTVLDDVRAVTSLVGALDAPPHVLGHSYGGHLALKAAMEVPVASLCLLEPVCYGLLRALGDDAATSDLHPDLDQDAMVDEASGGSEIWLQGFIDYWNGPGSWDALPPKRRAAYLQVGRKVFREVQSVWVNDTPPERYAGIPAPTTLAISEHTTAGARRVGEVLVELMPATRVHHVQGHGHLFPVLDPAGTAALVERHLTWSEGTEGRGDQG